MHHINSIHTCSMLASYTHAWHQQPSLLLICFCYQQLKVMSAGNLRLLLCMRMAGRICWYGAVFVADMASEVHTLACTADRQRLLTGCVSPVQCCPQWHRVQGRRVLVVGSVKPKEMAGSRPNPHKRTVFHEWTYKAFVCGEPAWMSRTPQTLCAESQFAGLHALQLNANVGQT